MKVFFVIFFTIFLAGCGSIHKMNENMQRSNTLIQENTTAIEKSVDTVQANTAAVKASTQTLRESKEVIADNTLFIKNFAAKIGEHPYFLPITLALILIALFLPSFFLFLFFRRIIQKIGKDK